MEAKTLKSWKIQSPNHFYPISIQSIGYDTEYAISVYALHTVNTFIFRNFKDAILNDKSPHKCYLHPSLYPECIIDVVVGGSETIVLTKCGKLKYFKSPKKLVNVDYLQNVKAICHCQDGFALIKMNENINDFSIENHPDSFHDDIADNDRKIFHLNFESNISCWSQSAFKIKEIYFPKHVENKLITLLLANNNAKQSDYILFFSMDRDLFVKISPEHADNGDDYNDECITVSIAVCTSEIENFWSINNGNVIAILLKSSILQLIFLNEEETAIKNDFIYLGKEVNAYEFINDSFVYSNGCEIEMIDLMLLETNTLKLQRSKLSLSGIVAFTFVKEFSLLLSISENGNFYGIFLNQIKIDKKMLNKFNEIDETINYDMKKMKIKLLELTDAYNQTIAKRIQNEDTIKVIELKQQQQQMNQRPNFNFHAKCILSKTPLTISNIKFISIKNNLLYDRHSSKFAHIILTTAIYANQFNANRWNLSIKWQNQSNQTKSINLKLPATILSSTFGILLHFDCDYLDKLQIDINTLIKNVDQTLLISFPVQITYDYKNLFTIQSIESTPMLMSESEYKFYSLISLPKKFCFNEMIFDNANQNKNIETNNKHNVLMIEFFEQNLFIICNDRNIELKTNHFHVMRYTKTFIYDTLKCSMVANKLPFRVISNALKEYNVSIFGM